ncbi:MAG: hypothetical protein MI700_05645 [Balneolales bacterium]|nr:hypothetical protein [Balneolales bacterium]
MPSLTLSLGILLVILGGASYFGTGMESITALIPAFFGLLFIGFGVLARQEALRKHVMHAAVGFALLGVIGAARGIPGLMEILQGNEVERPVAIYAQVAMLLMCLVYIVKAVQSFRAARLAKDSDAA